jgi:hypothetical protein
MSLPYVSASPNFQRVPTKSHSTLSGWSERPMQYSTISFAASMTASEAAAFSPMTSSNTTVLPWKPVILVPTPIARIVDSSKSTERGMQISSSRHTTPLGMFVG